MAGVTLAAVRDALLRSFTDVMQRNSLLRGVRITGAGISAVPGHVNPAWQHLRAAGPDACAREAAARHAQAIDRAVLQVGLPSDVWPHLLVDVRLPVSGAHAAVSVAYARITSDACAL